MAYRYLPESRALQDHFDTRRLADRVGELTHDHRTVSDREVLARADMFFLASVGCEGRPTCSYEGGEPGFVRALDEHTLAFPSYDGNGMFLSLGNVRASGKVGMLFVDFEERTRMRIHGEASIDLDDQLVGAWPEAKLVVRVRVSEVFPNCPRHIHGMQRVEPSRFVPRAGCVTPAPAWKQADSAKDALPDGDPAGDPTREVLRM